MRAETSGKVCFEWEEEMEYSLNVLKEAMTHPPVLEFLDFEKPFIVETDESSEAVGEVLLKKDCDGRGGLQAAIQ